MQNKEKIIFDFKAHLKALGRSPATVEAYTMHASLFVQVVEADNIKAVNKGHIEAYIESLFAAGKYTVGSISVKIKSIKRLFEFLESSNRIFLNPAESIKEPKKDKSLPRHVLTAKEMQLLLDQPNLGLMTGIRDRAILEVFYTTGIRLEELCRLTVFDADLQGGLLRVNNGKGGKDRVVPMGRHAVKCLREYITKARPRLTKNNRKVRHVFVNCYGGPMKRQSVGIMIRTYARKAGLKKKVTAHGLRHTFATALVKNGADIRAVQKMLGHKELNTTQQYIRGLGLDIKAVHQKTHPREKDKPGKSIKPEISMMRGCYER
jgi:integrase/recombinase XerD